MKRIRLASPEEIESIKSQSDLDDGCNVFALETQNGTGLAVRRLCMEIDPMVTPEDWNPRLRSMFIRDLETVMAAQGVSHYYFTADATDVAWQEFVKAWGAEQVTPKPVLRFKRTL